MALGKFKTKLFGNDNENDFTEDDFYLVSEEDAEEEAAKSGSKMILIEPRANSESQQIADHLKNRNSVVVNLRRVTPAQAKRIIDFLSGTIYAIGGGFEQIGSNIYLCTPKNVHIQGKMTDDKNNSKDVEEDLDI